MQRILHHFFINYEFSIKEVFGMEKKIGAYSNENNAVSVSLHANPFAKDENSQYIVNATRRTVDLNNLIAGLAESNTGVDVAMVRHSAELLKREIISKLQSGKAVNVLDLGTLYIGAAGTMSKSDVTTGTVPGFEVRFTPSKDVKSAVTDMEVDKIVMNDPAPVIAEILSLPDKKTDGNLTAGKMVRITGSHLKLISDQSAVYFVPFDESNNLVTDESRWVTVSSVLITRNLPGTLEFFLPELEADTSYKIAVRSYENANGKDRKTPVTGISSIAVKLA